MTESGQANHITIDGKPYFLAVDADRRPTWVKDYVPTQDGDPLNPQRARFNDWSRGLGDSRGLLRGAVEYAENAYLGNIGRLLPGPLITQITTSHSADICTFVDVTLPANRVLAGGGTKISEINPASQSVATTRTPSGSASVLSMALFIDQVAIALGDSVAFDRRAANGTYSQNSDSLMARAFGISGSTLVRGRDAYWSRCSAAAFQTAGNWSTEFDIGDRSGKINQVFAQNRFDYILKDEGLYTYDESGNSEVNVLADLKAWKSPENRAYGAWLDLLFIPSLAGLYRVLQQNSARPVGLEEVTLNENEMLNAWPTAFAAFGKWAYVAYYNGTSTWICIMRRAQDGDAGLGSPFTIVSVIDKFTGKCQAMHVSSLTTPPTLYYGAGGNVKYLTLSRNGLPTAYQTANTTTVRMSPTDLNSPMTVKFFRSIEVFGRNITSGANVQMKAIVDDGSLNNVGSAITSLSSGYAERFWTQGSNDSGRKIQLVVTMANSGGGSSPAEIRELQLNYEERPAMTASYSTIVRAQDSDSEGGLIDNRSAARIRADLEALIDGAVVDVRDPFGDTYKARICGVRETVLQQMRDSNPIADMPIQIRRLDYA